ncbi:MAG: class I SAM-dependent methyltransferase [Bacteroidota bacterium]
MASSNPTEYTHNESEGRERLNPSIFHARFYYLRQLRKLIEYAINNHLKGRGGVLFDYGCGAMPYRPLFQGAVDRYVGADLGENPGAELVIQPEGRIEVDDQSANIVLSTQVLEHVDNPAEYLREARRVLKDDGVLILTTHGYWMYHPDPNDFWRWTSSGLQKIVREAGFDVVDFRGIIGRPAMGLQLFQDGLMFKFPKIIRTPFVFFMQFFIWMFDKVSKQSQRDADGCTYLVVARVKK